MNSRQVSRIDLSPDLVDCVAFWTKNPAPMMGRIGELGKIPYYIQFTLTGYGRDIEPGLPDKRQLIEIFRETAELAGAKRLVWRYDPIFFNEKYTKEYHCRAFREIARGLSGFTEKTVISFLDIYGKTKRNMRGIPVTEPDEEMMSDIAGSMASIAGEYGIRVESCAEKVDLSGVGVEHGCCIDPGLIEVLTGRTLLKKKDRNQRAECGCIESVEVGAYDTCLCGCKYCYANDSLEAVMRKRQDFDGSSPLLCSVLREEDRITTRRTGKLFAGAQRKETEKVMN